MPGDRIPTVMDNLDLLEREMYSEAEAARLLGVAQGTLHYWLEGRAESGRRYRPVVRLEPKGGRAPVTWAEFVEAGLLREYRRTHKVAMAELRAFIDRLREEFGVPYPLADRRPYVSGRALVWEAQQAAGLPSDLWLVAVAGVGEQYMLTPPSDAFLKRAKWTGEVATAWKPSADPNSPVLIDPLTRFGRPSVGGVSTEVIWEHDEAGEPKQEIAEMFGLTLREVRWALAYENSLRAA